MVSPSQAQIAELSFAPAGAERFDSSALSARSIERRVFDLVNNERVKIGLQPLIWLDRAADSARTHSQDMAGNNYFSHKDLGGKLAGSRADKCGLNDWRLIGENIAWISGGGDTASRTVNSWMRSEGHRENMLNPKFKESGIGLAVTREGKYYFTQILMLRR